MLNGRKDTGYRLMKSLTHVIIRNYRVGAVYNLWYNSGMKRKRLAVATGIFSVLGLAAFLGHQKQVNNHALETTILKEVRQFFEPMGTIEVIYTTGFDARKRVMTGGIVFSDKVVFLYHYDKGIIDYKLDKDSGGSNGIS